MEQEIVKFLRRKDYKLIKIIGQGGMGQTVLLHDDIIDEFFVCKKYVPYDEQYRELLFNNFVDEIKILHKVFHKNIVRIYNYHLYPEQITGYILMEYIDGDDIETYLREFPNRINEVFEQVIDGFCHLEEIGVLHRDIRPQNILVSKDGFVKIIDFGFGKSIDFAGDFVKSITLNWPYTFPNDFKSKIYDFRTEVYFLGKLFDEIIYTNKIESFLYVDVLKKMIENDYENRIDSFLSIKKIILSGEIESFAFSKNDKITYRIFADNLISIFVNIKRGSPYINDIDMVVREVDRVIKDSLLEDYIQSPNALASCFVKGGYRYHTTERISVKIVKNFYQLLKNNSLDKQQIILNNLWRRLDNIRREETDDLPF